MWLSTGVVVRAEPIAGLRDCCIFATLSLMNGEQEFKL